MRKSLIIIASALVLAVAAASTGRLRYDSTVFAEATGPSGGPRTTRVEYPPCVKGVREDSCIQLYERGVRRNYERWLIAHGRSPTRVAAVAPARSWRTCRGKRDDQCVQRGRVHGRVARHARVQQARHAVRVRHAVQAQPVRQVRVAPATRKPQPAVRPEAQIRPRSNPVSTPGI